MSCPDCTEPPDYHQECIREVDILKSEVRALHKELEEEPISREARDSWIVQIANLKADLQVEVALSQERKEQILALRAKRSDCEEECSRLKTKSYALLKAASDISDYMPITELIADKFHAEMFCYLRAAIAELELTRDALAVVKGSEGGS